MIKRHLEELKKQSPERKNHLSYLFAGITTLVIIGCWLLLSAFLRPLHSKKKEPFFDTQLQSFFEKMTELKNPLN